MGPLDTVGTACGDAYDAHGSAESEQLEIEVRAYRRVIKNRRYRRRCQCEGAPRLLTAPARLVPQGILGISRKIENHAHSAAIHYMHYNFCRCTGR